MTNDPIAVMRTRAGRMINVHHPDPADILVTDIAHHAAHIDLFGGTGWRHYSVAAFMNDVWWATNGLPKEYRFTNMMALAHMAYIPVPMMPGSIHAFVQQYDYLTHIWQEAIGEKFEIDIVGLITDGNDTIAGHMQHAYTVIVGDRPGYEPEGTPTFFDLGHEDVSIRDNMVRLRSIFAENGVSLIG